MCAWCYVESTIEMKGGGGGGKGVVAGEEKP